MVAETQPMADSTPHRLVSFNCYCCATYTDPRPYLSSAHSFNNIVFLFRLLSACLFLFSLSLYLVGQPLRSQKDVTMSPHYPCLNHSQEVMFSAAVSVTRICTIISYMAFHAILSIRYLDLILNGSDLKLERLLNVLNSVIIPVFHKHAGKRM